MLESVDAAADGRSYREIAHQVFGHGALSREPWRTSSLRDTTIRLVRAGRRMVDSAYASC